MRGANKSEPRPGKFLGKSLAAAALLAALLATIRAPAEARPIHSSQRAIARPQIGRASYYHPRLAGRRTASGLSLRLAALTAASRTLPLGTRARVTNTKNGRSVAVTVTDRGPFVRRRILDVSPAAAERLGMIEAGVALVKVEPLQTPPR